MGSALEFNGRGIWAFALPRGDRFVKDFLGPLRALV